MSSPDPNTIDLLHRIKAQDAGAGDELYEKFYDRVLAVVRLRLGAKLRSKLESIDVVQDAFLRSLKSLDDFEYKSDGAFMHFLSHIVEHVIRDKADYFAAQKRDMAREKAAATCWPSQDTAWGPILDLASSTTPSMIVGGLESVLRLEMAIDRLSSDQREAIILTRYEGMSHEEAGGILGKSADAVRMLVARGMVQLNKLLTNPAEAQ